MFSLCVLSSAVRLRPVKHTLRYRDIQLRTHDIGHPNAWAAARSRVQSASSVYTNRTLATSFSPQQLHLLTGTAHMPPLDSELNEEFFGYGPDERTHFEGLENAARYGALYRHPIVPTALSTDGGENDGGTATQLSVEEVQNRRNDNENRLAIPKPQGHEHITVEDVLACRALPCLLTTGRPSTRPMNAGTDRRLRTFPNQVNHWLDHTTSVLAHTSQEKLPIERENVMRRCWYHIRECVDEIEERFYLRYCVLDALPVEFGRGSDVQGYVDDTIVDPVTRRVLVCIEYKSTQCLRLPERPHDIVASYVKRDWRTTHPIGQLVEYLRQNNCRYGVLTSGTRTYFVRIDVVSEGEGAYVEVRVSRRWYTSEPQYLRAWAFIVHQAKKISVSKVDLRKVKNGWTFPANTRGAKRKKAELRTSGSPPNSGFRDRATSMERQKAGHEAQDAQSEEPWELDNIVGVREVDEDDVIILWDKRLGSGRNGPVFEALWNGRRVAVKQFALDHDDGLYFQQEIEAYAALRDLQGEAVARLLFVSRSWCGTLRLMGIELGQQVVGDEANLQAEMARVQQALRHAGWSQPSEERKIENYVWQEDGKLVAIDLEMLERASMPKTRDTSASDDGLPRDVSRPKIVKNQD